MARIFTTPDAEAAAKAFIHDITFVAGLHSDNKRGKTYSYMVNSSYKQAAEAICDELVNRDFANIDRALSQIAGWSFYSPLTGINQQAKRLKAPAIAKSLVYFAELLNIYWDDTIRTPFEIDEFKKSMLGSAVYKYGRYISAIKDPKTKKSASNKSSGNTSSAKASQPATGSYKQSGPQSSNVRDLIGQPGEKVLADNGIIYKIIGDDAKSKNVPNVFIKPLSASGATGNTNKIFMSSGNGYTDCTCFFDDPNKAQDFLDKIEAAGRIPSNVSNVRVVKLKADANGYFLVGTEFGECAISAKKLNEALEGDLNEKLASWEKATENYSDEELKELHTWMRRG